MRAVAIVLGAFVFVMIVVWVAVTIGDHRQEMGQRHCAAVASNWVSTGSGHWLCVTPDGRIVDHG